MTQQRIPLVIQLSAAATSAGPFPLDYRFGPMQIRSIAGSCTSTDTVKVLVSPFPFEQNARFTVAGDLTTRPESQAYANHGGFFTTVSSYGGSFQDVVNGPWCQVKVEKSGTAGAATVYIVG
jgi:hypothetical protein